MISENTKTILQAEAYSNSNLNKGIFSKNNFQKLNSNNNLQNITNFDTKRSKSKNYEEFTTLDNIPLSKQLEFSNPIKIHKKRISNKENEVPIKKIINYKEKYSLKKSFTNNEEKIRNETEKSFEKKINKSLEKSFRKQNSIEKKSIYQNTADKSNRSFDKNNLKKNYKKNYDKNNKKNENLNEKQINKEVSLVDLNNFNENEEYNNYNALKIQNMHLKSLFYYNLMLKIYF